jgi:tetratricopeptide (TPR) repeat protein
LLEAALRISPINPTARLARAQIASKSSESTKLARNLSLSRDATSLAWSARGLRLAGKKEAAIRVYRQALRIACRPTLALASDPAFNDDPSVRRYFLPGETSALAIVRELIADADWTFQDWSEAIPRNTVAALAAARLLHEQERPEAQVLLKQILEQEQVGPTSGAELAIRTAMIAEAHALLSQWKEAEHLYRHAIDHINDVTIQRSWWFNLANVALQLNDETQRKAAIEAALEVPTSDDISRRALELQRTSEPLGRLRSSGTKAN